MCYFIHLVHPVIRYFVVSCGLYAFQYLVEQNVIFVGIKKGSKKGGKKSAPSSITIRSKMDRYDPWYEMVVQEGGREWQQVRAFVHMGRLFDEEGLLHQNELEEVVERVIDNLRHNNYQILHFPSYTHSSDDDEDDEKEE